MTCLHYRYFPIGTSGYNTYDIQMNTFRSYKYINIDLWESSGFKPTQLIDLKRSSHTDGNPKGTHLGFMQKWTQKNRSGHEMTRSGCLRIGSIILRWVQAYPSDRSEEKATHPKGVLPPRETSARSQGKWSLILMKFDI